MSNSSSSHVESITGGLSSMVCSDDITEIANGDPIRGSLDSNMVDLAQVRLTGHGEALRFVAPTGLPVRFRDMLQSYLDAFCVPWNQPIVLPKAPTDDTGASPVVDLIRQFCRSFPRCLILRQFRVNEDRTRLSKELGFTDNAFKSCDELELDLFCIVPSGVTAVLTVPAEVQSIDEFIAEPRFELLFDWLSDMLPKGSDVQLWLLVSSEESPRCGLKEAGKVHYRFFKGGALRTNLTGLFSHESVMASDDQYTDTCGKFVAIWAAVAGKRQTMDVDLDILDVNDGYLPTAESYLAEVAPQWRSGTRSYMFPPIFKHPTPEPIFVNVSEGDLPSGGKLEVKSGGGGLAGNLVGSDAEQKVFRALEQFGRITENMPLLCFHSVKVDDGMIPILNKMLSSSGKENPFKAKMSSAGDGDNFEIDFVCIHPKHGIILVEVKSEYGSRQEARARNELKQAEQFLKKFADVLGIPWNDHACLKIIAFPNTADPAFLQTKRIKLQTTELDIIEDIPILQEDLDFSAMLSQCCRDATIISRCRPDNSSLILFTKTAPAIALLHRIGSKLELKIAGAVKVEADLLDRQQLAGEKPLSKLVKINKHTVKKSAQDKSADAPDPIVLKQLVNIHFMTPEQMDIWNGGTHQLILGPPGSGKTILLMGAIADAVGHGRHVRIYCRDATRELYRTFAESITGGANLVCCKKFEGIKQDFKMTIAELKPLNVAQLYNLSREDLRKEEIQLALQGRKQPDEISNHKFRKASMTWRTCLEVIKRDTSGELEALRDTCVMMDDVDDDIGIGKEEGLFAVCCLQEKKFAQLWIAGSYGVWSVDAFALLSLLTEESRLSRLSTVLRNARGIYDVWSKWMNTPGVSNQEIKIGHRLEGREPELIQLDSVTDMHLKICDTIEHKLSGSSLSCSDIAILFGYGHYFNREVNRTKNELRRRDIPCNGIAEQAKRRRQGEHVVAVDHVMNSYSYEWPVVFYMTDISRKDDFDCDDTDNSSSSEDVEVQTHDV